METTSSWNANDPSSPIVWTERVAKRFGGVLAIADLSISILAGRLHCIIGPNGAGKTTFFNLLSGVIRPTSGRIYFRGDDITRLDPDEIARRGLVRTFQTPRPFLTLTVEENALLAHFGQTAGFLPFSILANRAGRLEGKAKALDVLERVGLLDIRARLVSSLAHGEKKRLELAVALACSPTILLLDEPTAGMNARETEEMSEIIRQVAHEITTVVIEHDLDFVRRMADFVTVLHQGGILCEGSVMEIENDDRVHRVYLGADGEPPSH